MDFLNSLTEATTNLEFMIKSSSQVTYIGYNNIHTLGTIRGSTAIKVLWLKRASEWCFWLKRKYRMKTHFQCVPPLDVTLQEADIRGFLSSHCVMNKTCTYVAQKFGINPEF